MTTSIAKANWSASTRPMKFASFQVAKVVPHPIGSTVQTPRMSKNMPSVSDQRIQPLLQADHRNIRIYKIAFSMCIVYFYSTIISVFVSR